MANASPSQGLDLGRANERGGEVNQGFLERFSLSRKNMPGGN
jgi:hypothetical protein